jgi:CSLREA domain-containing protein
MGKTAALSVLACVLAAGCIESPPRATTTTTTVVETTIEVNAFDDTDDGTCDEIHCSLREAIALADADPDLDTVVLPAGEFVIGGGGTAARFIGSRARPAAMALGPDGEAFRTTTDLTVEGAGAGSTVIDLSGDDFSVGWIAEASLTLRGLTVRNLGSGTTPADRMVVVGQMAEADEEVAFESAVVEDVQPDMAPPAPGPGAGGGWLVSGMLPGATSLPDPPAFPFDVRIESTTVRHVARNLSLVLNWGGGLDVVGSTIEDTPPLGSGSPIGMVLPPGVSFFPGSLSVEGSRLEGLAGMMGGSSCTTFALTGGTGASLTVSDSAIVGSVPAVDAAACAGTTPSLVPSLGLMGDANATIDRSLVTSPPGVAYNLGALSLTGSCDDYGDSFVPSVTVQDSTLWSESMLGVVYGGCDTTTPPTGTGLLLRRSTATGVGTGGGGPPVTLESSVIVTPAGSVAGGGCSALNSAGVGMVISLGNNTAPVPPFPAWDCGLTAPGDQPDTDPMLGPLADNGGPTLTALPLAGSPLVDSAGACTGADQRGIGRPQGAACDRGAVEVVP